MFSPSPPVQSGLTPLHLAAQEDKVSVAEVLLNHGADVNPQTKVSAPLAHNTSTAVTLHDLALTRSFFCIIFRFVPGNFTQNSALQAVNRG